jgi:hypothetical protein
MDKLFEGIRSVTTRIYEGLGKFWKKHYNTPLGAGTVPKYVLKVQQTFKEYCQIL